MVVLGSVLPAICMIKSFPRKNWLTKEFTVWSLALNVPVILLSQIDLCVH